MAQFLNDARPDGRRMLIVSGDGFRFTRSSPTSIVVSAGRSRMIRGCTICIGSSTVEGAAGRGLPWESSGARESRTVRGPVTAIDNS